MVKIENLLPVGSVVQVKDAEKKLMIIGILMNNEGVRYDYMTVLFPEGYMDQQHMYLLNHEDIEKVLFLGYMNTEFQVFRGLLINELEK